jgi:hypothetical protein
MVPSISRKFHGNFRDRKLFYMYQRLISKLMIELEKYFHMVLTCQPLYRLLPPPPLVTLGCGLATWHHAGCHTLVPNEAVTLQLLSLTGHQPTGPKLLLTKIPSQRCAHAAVDGTAPPSWGAFASIISEWRSHIVARGCKCTTHFTRIAS